MSARRFTAKRAKLTAALMLLALLFTLAEPRHTLAAESPESKHKAVVVLIGSVNLDDLATARMPHLMRLLRQRGAIALMNARTAGAYLPEHGYVTLGSSTRALGSPTSGLAFESGEVYMSEQAGDIYRRNTGFRTPLRGAVTLDFANLLRLNSNLDHPVVIGALGQALRSAGRTVAVLGNADDAQGPSRLAVNVAMDERGQVPLAKVGSDASLSDVNFPSGRRTNYDYLFGEFEQLYSRSDLVVVETGDTYRLNYIQAWITADVYQKAQMSSLERADDFIGRISGVIDWKTTRLFVVSPFPASQAAANSTLLTFAVMAGPGVTPGLLYAPTTRRAGLVTVGDIGPTITDWLSAPAPAETTGRPLTSTAYVGSVPWLTKVNQQIVATYTERRPVLQTYVILQIIVIIGSILALFFMPRGLRRPARWLQRILLALTAVPLALLLLPAVTAGDPILDWFIIIGLTLALVLAGLIPGRKVADGFLIVYALTVIGLVYDLLTGTRLSRASILGFDPMSGSRYYGIGNEFSGVIIGATIIASTTLLDRFPKLQRYRFFIVIAPLALVAFLSGAPSYGADYGGLIAVVATIVAAWVGLSKNRPKMRRVLWVGLVGAVLVGGVAVYDSLRPVSEASHVGEFVRLVRTGGISQFFTVVARKLSMNWRLMHYTPWADGLLTFIVVLGILFYRPVGLLRRIIEKNPYFNKGFWIALVATVVAFLVNDSGVVEAATLMLYPVALLLAYTLDPAHHEPPKPTPKH